ncbi:MAG: hypothetical protein IKW30_07160 [Lachnospiraceae bacterium]|nr:hypothetical protein [Bacteroidales bacterium]MBR5597168.1 hypothetical protein [Lachnospiraceae bacterium]
MKQFKIIVTLIIALFAISCTNEVKDVVLEQPKQGLIKTESLNNVPQSRGDINLDNYSEGYLCSSDSSSIVAEIYVKDNKEETIAFVLNEKNEAAFCVHFKINSFINENACTFVAYNELEEPLMEGLFDTAKGQIEITSIYENDVLSRASAKAWLCNLSIGIAGGIMSTAAGMASAGAGFVVGLSYTALAVAACDGL